MSRKRIFSILAACFFLIAGGGSQLVAATLASDKADKAQAKSQKAELDSLRLWLKEARVNTNDKAKPNFDRARAALRKAMANPYGKQNPMVLLQAANTEYQCFQTERNKPASGGKMDEKVIYASTSAGFQYYCQAYELFRHTDHSAYAQFKAPSVKDYARMRSNAFELYRCTQGFRATAGYYFRQKDIRRAHDLFSLALHSIDCELLLDYALENEVMQADFEKYRTDSLRSQLKYSCAVTSVMLADHPQAIAELEAAKDCGVETNRVYQQLCKEYLSVSDTLKYVSTLQEGVRVLPDEAWFAQNLLNYYLSHSNHTEALGIVDHVIRTTPGNAYNVELKARLLDDAGRDDEAVEAYKQAIALDSTLYVSYINLGGIYYNRAVAVENEYIDSRRFDDIYDEVVPLYELALPYYLRAYDLDTKRQDTSVPTALRTILFKRFQSPRCKNSKQLIKKYNEISRAYGWSTL